MRHDPAHPYPYSRPTHLPFILRVPSDWLHAKDPAITALIVARLEQAAALQTARGPRARAIAWALAAELCGL